MRLAVLGSGAGGGIPQWNAKNLLSRRAASRDPAVSTRSQTSLAVSAGGERFVLLNAAPDMRAQILAASALTDPVCGLSPLNAQIRALAEREAHAPAPEYRYRRAPISSGNS